MWRSLSFLFREFVDGMSQNKFLHFAYGVQVSVSLLVLGVFFVILVGAAVLWARLGSGMDVRVFLDDSVAPNQTATLAERLSSVKHVREITFRSKEEAIQIFKTRYPGMPLEDLLGDNPLPASYVLKVDRPENIQQVAAECVDLPGVIHVAYPAEFLQRYLRVMLVLVVICIATISLLLLFAYSSINNIIGVSIYARRSEIRIMQLVGATWWFIRWPFLFEGVFFGAVGAVVALVVIWLFLAVLGEALHASALAMRLPWVELSSWQLFLWLSAALGLLGVVVGLFGSLKTVNAFLRREASATIDAQRVRQLLRR